MDAILTDPDVNTRFEICILMNVIVPKFECAGEVWQANAKFVKQLGTVQKAPAKQKMPGCLSTTRNIVFGQ